jgi:adenylate cyclase
LAADIAGYSSMMGVDEAGTLAVLREFWANHFNRAVAAHRGRVVKMMGDGALVEFASAVDAVDCALAIQLGMAAFNASHEDRSPVELRIGLNLGDIVIEKDDIFGDGVNVAARLEAQAPKSGILISDSVHSQIVGKVKADFVDAGELQLKNIKSPQRAWRWCGGHAQTTPSLPAQNAPGDKPSIAVLPFTSMSGDPEQEYFADGLVEDIITTLSKLAGLRVIARNSSFVYKGQAVDIRKVAKDLGVRHVMEGSTRRSGNRIRITAQLIDAATGSHIWAERYDREMDDIFAVQDEITLVLATEMQVKLTEGEQARLRYTTTSNVEAWNHWVKGLHYFRLAVTKDNTGIALACWQKALALEPHSASLNAMVGFIHYIDARFGWWDNRLTALDKALSYAKQALDLDPDNPDANTTAAFACLLQERFDEAADRARRAARMAPGSADVASFTCFTLAFAGYPQEAVTHGERSMTLSPHRPAFYYGHLGNAYRLAGRLDEAIAAFQAYNSLSPGFGLADLVVAYQQLEQPEAARQAAQQLLALRHDFTVSGWAKTQFRADGERKELDFSAMLAAGLPIN